jgi:hypothetical protein
LPLNYYAPSGLSVLERERERERESESRFIRGRERRECTCVQAPER